MHITDTKLYRVELNRVTRESLNIRVPKHITNPIVIENMIEQYLESNDVSEIDFTPEDDWIQENSVNVELITDNGYKHPEYAYEKLVYFDCTEEEFDSGVDENVLVKEIKFDSLGNELSA